MTTSLKDVSTAIMIGKLADMNAFAKEYDAWGYAWLGKDGRVKYCMSEEPMGLRRLRDKQREEGIAMTPLVDIAERAIVREEDYDDWIYVRKLNLAAAIRDDFSRAYFDILQGLIDASCDSLAMDILIPWKEEATGYFDEVSLDLFEGALHEARRMRHVTDGQYKELSRWLHQEKRQVLSSSGGSGLYSRTFRGIAYWEGERRKFFINANADAFYDRFDQLDEKNVDKTPIYSCTLRHVNSIPGSKWREEFQGVLEASMDDAYLQRIQALNALPSAVPGEAWDRAKARAEKECSETAQGTLERWGAQMRIA